MIIIYIIRMSLLQAIGTDVLYSCAGVAVVRGLKIDDMIDKSIGAGKAETEILIALATGSTNYVTDEVLNYFMAKKVPDLLTMNYLNALDSIAYFSGVAMGGRMLKLNDTIANLADGVLPREYAGIAIDGALLSAARVGRNLANGTSLNYIAHPITLFTNTVGVTNASPNSSGVSSSYKF
jgi:hypothetical protein